MSEPIPLNVVTGFLGAGKTTLINRLLRAPELADALVIVNEWGEIGLDHLLFEAISGDVVLMPSGCLCCSLRGDLIDCLHDLIARRDSGVLAPFSRIVLETSGLSDPTPILHALIADPVLAERTQLAGVVTLIDAVNGEASLAARLAALRAALGDINPVAPLFDVAAGEFDLADFLAEPLAVPHAPGSAPESRHSSSIRAYAFVEPEPLGAPALARFLEALCSLLGPRLLRVKGLAAIADHPAEPLLIHGAQHVFHAPRRLPAWPDGGRDTRIVVIVDGVDPKAMARLGAALSNRPRIDTPDLAALSDNPLAPRLGGLLG
jgi:G3E family GTPase